MTAQEPWLITLVLLLSLLLKNPGFEDEHENGKEVEEARQCYRVAVIDPT